MIKKRPVEPFVCCWSLFRTTAVNSVSEFFFNLFESSMITCCLYQWRRTSSLFLVLLTALVDNADPTEVRMIGRRRNALLTSPPYMPDRDSWAHLHGRFHGDHPEPRSRLAEWRDRRDSNSNNTSPIWHSHCFHWAILTGKGLDWHWALGQWVVDSDRNHDVVFYEVDSISYRWHYSVVVLCRDPGQYRRGHSVTVLDRNPVTQCLHGSVVPFLFVSFFRRSDDALLAWGWFGLDLMTQCWHETGLAEIRWSTAGMRLVWLRSDDAVLAWDWFGWDPMTQCWHETVLAEIRWHSAGMRLVWLRSDEALLAWDWFGWDPMTQCWHETVLAGDPMKHCWHETGLAEIRWRCN